MLKPVMCVSFDALIDYALAHQVLYSELDVVDAFLAVGKRDCKEEPDLGVLDKVVLRRLRNRLTLQQAILMLREQEKVPLDRQALERSRLVVVHEDDEYRFFTGS